MKQLNHGGSATLILLTLALAALLVLSALGIHADWKPWTTPYRLVNEPFIGWSLLIVLTAGLVLIRKGPALLQCVSTLLFVGMILGLGAASALFWDAWLAPMLIYAALPMLGSAVSALKAMVPADGTLEPARDLPHP